MARAIRKRQVVESEDDEGDDSQSESEEEEEESEEDDERPRKKGRASTSTTYSRKGAASKGGRGKAPAPGKQMPAKGSAGGKGKRRAAVSDDEGDEVLEVEEAGEEEDDDGDGDEGGAGGQAGKQAKDKAGPNVSRYAQQVVRLALFAEASQGMLKREDINKKILGKDTRSFVDVLALAQRTLRKTFALELVEARPKGKGLGGADDVAAEADKLRSQAAGGSRKAPAKKGGAKKKGKGGKKRRRGEDESESEDEEEEEDDDDDGGAANGRVSNRKKATGPARAYILRSLLPRDLVQSIAVPSPAQDPGTAFAHDAVPSGPILDFDKDGGMALMGVLYVVLALILVTGRRLPDDHLNAYLKKLDLHPTTRLPTSQTTAAGQPLTVDGFLAACVRHAYLERAKAAKGVFGASQAASAGRGGGGRGRGKEGEDGGEEDVVWAWGPRAEVEVSERGLTEFVGDLYLGPLAGDEGEGEGLTREERKAREERRRKERKRLRVDVKRAAGGELQGSVEDYP